MEEFLHQTSFADAALESLGARPLHGIRFTSMSREELATRLGSLRWVHDPWIASVRLMMSTLLEMRELEPPGARFAERKQWLDAAFAWLDRRLERRRRLLRPGRVRVLYTAAWFAKPPGSDLVATYLWTKCLLYASMLPLEDNPPAPLFAGVDLRYR